MSENNKPTNSQIEVLLVSQILQNLQTLNEGMNQLLETQSILIKDITELKIRFDER